MASQNIILSELNVQHQTANQHRDAVATTAQIEMHNVRHEIQATSSRIRDLSDQLIRTQGLHHGLVVQENARSNVT